MSLFRSWRSLGFAVLVLVGALAPISAEPLQYHPLVLEDGKHTYSVKNAQVILDAEHTRSIDEIRRLESAGEAAWNTAEKLNLGYSKARYWLKVDIDSKSSDEQDWVLEFGYPLIQVLNVYKYENPAKPEVWHTGKLAPFNSRPIAHRNYLFNFKTRKGGRVTFYFMLESSGTLLAPISIYSQKEFLGRNSSISTGIGIYCGVILAMVLFNFFLLATSRDKNYIYYIGYALSFCLLMNTLNGMTYQHLWPELPAWNNISVPVLAGICYLFLALFTRSILDTRKYAPRANAGLYLITAGALFLIFGGIFHYGLVVNKFTSFFISAAPLIVLPISLWCMYKGSPAAGYYSLAFTFFFLGAAIRAARDLAWIPQTLLADYGPYFGSAVEMLLLSLALAVRLRILKEEKLKSELHALAVERDLAINRNELEKQTALTSFAAQVAHDIRSPLVALDAALENTAVLPEKQRTIVRHSLNRIRDVANSLLERNLRQQATASATRPDAGEPSEIRLLSSLTDAIISEKRTQYGSKPGIEIYFRPTRESYGLFAAIQPIEFGRLLSNLVNNSVEALGNKGKVGVRITENGNRVLLTITDTGKGIPPEILVKLGKKGETHGKSGGSGLGLFHARTAVESWGGSLNIASPLGKGAIVTIKLPKAPAPEYFVSSLELIPGSVVIVLDDDKGIHSLWQNKFESVGLKEHNIEVLYFSEPEGLRAWAKAEPARAKPAICLFDYELSDYTETGLSLAEELGLCQHTILVTGRSEEKSIMEACARLKVRSIPKSMLKFVAVKIGAPARAVLIDDDTIVHMNWEAAAEEAGIELKTYKGPVEFLQNLETFSKVTPIYIDSELGVDLKGEEVAATLKEKGFTNLTLVTGYSPERFSHLPWLKVRGKESPWRA